MALSGNRVESSGGLREFLQSPKGKLLSAVAGVIFLIAALVLLRQNLAPSEAEAISRDRLFMDAKTGKSFSYEISAGDTIPVKAPSGDKTGYPAELCYWTKDGQVKKDPTPVLLRRYLGKTGPTFCPDCGRLVVGHNPAAVPGAKPPPTEAEYNATKGSSPREERE